MSACTLQQAHQRGKPRQALALLRQEPGAGTEGETMEPCLLACSSCLFLRQFKTTCSGVVPQWNHKQKKKILFSPAFGHDVL